MKILYPLVAVVLLISAVSCNKKADKNTEESKTSEKVVPELKITIDSSGISTFYQAYPKLIKFQSEVQALYKKNKSTQLWLDNKGVVEYANTLFNKYKGLDQEGLKANFPYNEKINPIFEHTADNKLSKADTDLMITNLYFYYVQKVSGVDEKTTRSLEWLLPRKKVNYQVF